MKELLKLKNIGEVSAKMLSEIDVNSKADIVKLGPATIYHILKAQGYYVNPMVVYALYGAVHNKHYNDLTKEEKASLKKEIDACKFETLEQVIPE